MKRLNVFRSFIFVQFFYIYLQQMLPNYYLLQIQSILQGRQTMSDQTFQQYSKTLKTFYLKVLKNHSSMLKLSRNFMQMMQELSKPENILRNSRLSQKKSEKSITLSNRSRDIKSLRDFNSPKTAKSSYIYTSPDLKKVILYSYLHHIITVSNTQIFNIIETKSKLLIESVEENKILDRLKWDRCVNQWKKIMQLMNHKNKVRWQKMMNISITSLQPEFLDVVLRSILQSSSQMQTIFGNFQSNIELTSGLLKVSILYEEYDKSTCLKKIQAGDSKYQIKIGYLKHENIYVYYDKLLVEKPEQPETEKNIEQKKQKDINFLSVRTQGSKQSNQLISSPASSKNDSEGKSRKDIDQKSQQSLGQSTKKRPTLPPTLIKKKNLRIIQSLLKEYYSNTGKLLSMECFQNQQSKDAKIKRILQSRRKIQQ